MAVFFRAGKKMSLCADCGTLIRDVQRDKHLVTAFHGEAAATRMYRHRDDSEHSVTGQSDCYICTELRRIAREHDHALVETWAGK